MVLWDTKGHHWQPFDLLFKSNLEQQADMARTVQILTLTSCLNLNEYFKEQGITLITLLRIPILRPNWQYKASTAEKA